jgi:hypothetical protein
MMCPTHKRNGLNESKVSTESKRVFADFYGLWALLIKQYFSAQYIKNVPIIAGMTIPGCKLM